MKKEKMLVRSRSDKMIAGVCAGIANYFEIDPAIIRIGFILITLMGGAGVLAYFILWLVLPAEGSKKVETEAQIKANASEIKDRAEAIARSTRGVNNRPLWGIFLVGLGVIILLQNFGFARFLDWGKLWPVILIVVGFMILTKKND